MTEDLGLSPMEVYNLYTNPKYVVAKGEDVEDEGGLKVLNTIVTSPWLGQLILSSIYNSKLKKPVPVIILTKEQMKTLRKRRVRFFVRRRQKGKEGFIGFPNREDFRKIVSF